MAAEAREVWAVNKPAGVVSTAREPGRRPAVVELVDSEARLYPVGRLDVDSTGLLLLTNDGELANRLTHPALRSRRRPTGSSCGGRPSEADLRRLASGVELEDGLTAPAEVGGSASARSRSSCARAATARCGAWPRRSATGWRRLRRVRFGPIELGDLPEGGARLSPDEVAALPDVPSRLDPYGHSATARRLWEDARHG